MADNMQLPSVQTRTSSFFAGGGAAGGGGRKMLQEGPKTIDISSLGKVILYFS